MASTARDRPRFQNRVDTSVGFGNSIGVSDETYPVTVPVRRPDGSVMQVRVGSAVRTEEGFSLSLGELAIGANPDPRRTAASVPSAGEGPSVFPPYGRSKGQPIRGATEQDLEFYANGSRRSLGDPGKERWHEKEKALLAAIEAEMSRQGLGRGDANEPPALADEDAPF